MSEYISDTIQAAKEVCEFRKHIFDKVKAWHNSCADNIDASEFGDMIDVVKDLADTEKLCWEAAYFRSVVEAMANNDDENEDADMRYGYNHNHYRSSGRFASKGHGTYMGYSPMMEPEMWMRLAKERFGYSTDPERTHHSGMGDVRTGVGMNGMPYHIQGETPDKYGYRSDPEYGRAYNMYREHRRHYTETKDQADRDQMSRHAEEHLHKSIETIRDIWADVDPAMRKKMKTELQGLVGEMNA